MCIGSSVLINSMIFALVALPLSAASVQTIKPEEIGLSSERLQRIHETVQRHIDAHDISGAVTVVARKGRLAHLEAHGLMDIDYEESDVQRYPFLDCLDVQADHRDGHSDAYGGGQNPAHRSGIQIHSRIPRHEGGGDAGAANGSRRSRRRARGTAVLYGSGDP